MRRSLENRARRLEEGLKRAQDLARHAPPDLPDPEELDEMEESERERLEAMLEAVTLAGSADQVRQEVQELRRLAVQALAVEETGAEAKLSELKDLLQKEGFFDHPDQRLLLFTEFKDTLDYLVERLKSWGFRVGCIHGGMKSGSRDELGTRLHAEQQFREGEIQILVATEAAGEGINLQVCNILFNYDIPWNPNRLEQRMGRIHRYGQRKDCLIFNFVATNTIEGRVLQRLLEKLQEIRDALEDDAVFNVVGEVLPAAHVVWAQQNKTQWLSSENLAHRVATALTLFCGCFGRAQTAGRLVQIRLVNLTRNRAGPPGLRSVFGCRLIFLLPKPYFSVLGAHVEAHVVVPPRHGPCDRSIAPVGHPGFALAVQGRMASVRRCFRQNFLDFLDVENKEPKLVPAIIDLTFKWLRLDTV